MKLPASLLLLQVILGSAGSSQELTPEITKRDLAQHVRLLSADSLEGRLTGKHGNIKAAAYISQKFGEFGLQPLADDGSYLQTFEFVEEVALGDSNSLWITKGTEKIQFTLRSDFQPLGFSTNSSISGSIVFAGYGISAPDKGYDDYEGIDVSGKIVLVLRYSPDGTNPHGELQEFSSFRNKARLAREKGAIAVLVATGELDDPDDELVRLRYDHSMATSGLPIISIKRDIANQLLAQASTTLGSIQDSINRSRKPLSFMLPPSNQVALETDLKHKRSTSSNVIGFLPATNPIDSEAIVIGAHFDHLGYGGEGSGSLSPDSHEIHNGADDNASGTAALLELAQVFVEQQDNLRRHILFIAFTGEELGLLGSSHYVKEPLFPLEKTVGMINMDMIGRLNAEKKLIVYGTGSSPSWEDLLRELNRVGEHDSLFMLSFVSDGFGPSDHSSFYGKDIPVLFFFTGTHNEYHKPTDDADLINFEGEEQVVRYIAAVASAINVDPSRPSFARVPQTSSRGGGEMRGFKVSLGIIPDYGETAGGMKIGGIRPDGTAEKAGMLPGDIIVRMAGKDVLNIYDYMAILGTLKSGDVVEVEVMRDGKKVNLTATMHKR